ncbi:uncharacterized protein [Watersipora subatra]|uniref:uncharacterized protein n=1 Tax=Watersipora subatra TaxID=2589382 RepID=UPI00355B6CC9
MTQDNGLGGKPDGSAKAIPEDTHDNLINAFDTYFGVRTNTIVERAKFNKLAQGNDGIDVFINKLYRQAEYCNYGALREELIHGRLVVGVTDDSLSKKLQSELDLTLNTAVDICRRYKPAKQAQTVVRPSIEGSSESVDSVKHGKNRKSMKATAKNVRPITTGAVSYNPYSASQPKACHRCGKGFHPKSSCPAIKSVCNHCRKIGHWKSVCRQLSKVSEVQVAENISTPHFLGEVKPVKVDNCSWSVRINNPFSDCPEVISVFKLDTGAAVSVCSVDSFGGKHDFKSEYPEVFCDLGKLADPYTIQKRDDAKPVALHIPYEVSMPRLQIVKKQLDDIERKEVISKVTVPTDWCAGMVQVPKADQNQIRICADFTNLNKAVRRNTYPSTSVDSSLAKISGAKFMSKLDANSGYYQIPLSDESRLLPKFVTPFGRYCYSRVPIGLVSAGDIFQRCIYNILEGLDGVVCHINDLLVYSSVSEQEHDDRVRKVLQRLRVAGMTLNAKKCCFSQRSTKFLGHLVDAEGVRPDPDRIRDIQNLADPTNVTELQSLLGTVNQLGKFSPRITELMIPLRAVLKSPHWIWMLLRSKPCLTLSVNCRRFCV